MLPRSWTSFSFAAPESAKKCPTPTCKPFFMWCKQLVLWQPSNSPHNRSVLPKSAATTAARLAPYQVEQDTCSTMRTISVGGMSPRPASAQAPNQRLPSSNARTHASMSALAVSRLRNRPYTCATISAHQGNCCLTAPRRERYTALLIFLWSWRCRISGVIPRWSWEQYEQSAGLSNEHNSGLQGPLRSG